MNKCEKYVFMGIDIFIAGEVDDKRGMELFKGNLVMFILSLSGSSIIHEHTLEEY